jgi:hypothetical protein
MPVEVDFPTRCKNLRKLVKTIAAEVNDTHGHSVFGEDDEGKPESNYDEMAANLTICYRHLEDAAMRLGKAIQAYDGGKSVYDS